MSEKFKTTTIGDDVEFSLVKGRSGALYLEVEGYFQDARCMHSDTLDEDQTRALFEAMKEHYEPTQGHTMSKLDQIVDSLKQIGIENMNKLAERRDHD